ncbi:hypothetical protein Tco_0965233 [Tanacetum coccineum]
MENANPFVTAPPNGFRAMITQELNELRAISIMIDSRLENIDHTQIKIPPPVLIEQLLNDFMDSSDVLKMDDLESENESIDTPLVSPFLDSDDELDDREVLNELNEYGNAGNFYRNRIINSIDKNDLGFPVLKDIGELIVSDMSKVMMGRPFRAVTHLEYDCVKGLISFTRIFDTYIFQMPHTIPRLKNFSWSKVPPILVLSQRDLMSGLKYSHEKNKLMYKNCLNLGPEYQVNEDIKEWLTRGHVSIDGVT